MSDTIQSNINESRRFTVALTVLKSFIEDRNSDEFIDGLGFIKSQEVEEINRLAIVIANDFIKKFESSKAVEEDEEDEE